MLDQSFVLGGERRGEVAVDIQLTCDFSVDEDGDHDFGFSFERAGEITRVFADIVNHNGLATGGCGATNALVERNAGVGRVRAVESTQHQHRGLSAGLEHVKARPVVLEHAFPQTLYHLPHEIVSIDRLLDQCADLVVHFFDSAGEGHQGNLNSDGGLASEKLRPQGNLTDSIRLREQVGVDGAGEGVESAQKGRCRRVEVFIANAVDVAGAGSGSL